EHSCYGKGGIESLRAALEGSKHTFVAWVKAGHEVKQEVKAAVSDLLHVLVMPSKAYVASLGRGGGASRRTNPVHSSTLNSRKIRPKLENKAEASLAKSTPGKKPAAAVVKDGCIIAGTETPSSSLPNAGATPSQPGQLPLPHKQQARASTLAYSPFKRAKAS
ncbi:unnamed protein product, partial [Chrysoparadoxa australica]